MPQNGNVKNIHVWQKTFSLPANNGDSRISLALCQVEAEILLGQLPFRYFMLDNQLRMLGGAMMNLAIYQAH